MENAEKQLEEMRALFAANEAEMKACRDREAEFD